MLGLRAGRERHGRLGDAAGAWRAVFGDVREVAGVGVGGALAFVSVAGGRGCGFGAVAARIGLGAVVRGFGVFI